jgi:hypothetical protein
MTLVIACLALAGGAEGLAGAGAGPNRSGVVPSRHSEGKAPASDASEEMALRVGSEIVSPNIDN